MLKELKRNFYLLATASSVAAGICYWFLKDGLGICLLVFLAVYCVLFISREVLDADPDLFNIHNKSEIKAADERTKEFLIEHKPNNYHQDEAYYKFLDVAEKCKQMYRT